VFGRRYARSAFAFWILVAAASGGCSLIDTDDLSSGGPRDAGAHAAHPWYDSASPPADRDAGEGDAFGGGGGGDDAQSADASPHDARDASSTDATSIVDGDGDGDGDADVVFADDFEGPALLPRGWDFGTHDNGSLSISADVFVSPSHGLVATSLPIASGGFAAVALRKRLALPPMGSTARYTLRALLLQPDLHNGADAVIAALQLVDDLNETYELQIDTKLSAGAPVTICAEYAGLADGGALFVPHTLAGDLHLGAWNAIRIEVVRDSAYTVRVYFDDVLVLQTPLSVPFAPTGAQISAGLSFVRAPSDAWTIAYDDVVYAVR